MFKKRIPKKKKLVTTKKLNFYWNNYANLWKIKFPKFNANNVKFYVKCETSITSYQIKNVTPTPLNTKDWLEPKYSFLAHNLVWVSLDHALVNWTWFKPNQGVGLYMLHEPSLSYD